MTRRPWSTADLAQLRRLYPEQSTSRIAPVLRRSVPAVQAIAHKLGLTKSAAFRAAQRAFQEQRFRTDPRLTARRFAPGHVPANKGVKGWQSGGRSRETQFKPGHTYWDPEIYCVGALRINTYGELQIKIGPGPRSWIALGRYVWAMEFGRGRLPPRGWKVCYRNGDAHDTRPENLELRSDADVMRRNSVHNLPPPLVQVIQLQGVLKRRLRNAQKERAP